MTLRERLGRTYDIVAGSRILVERRGRVAGGAAASPQTHRSSSLNRRKRSRVTL